MRRIDKVLLRRTVKVRLPHIVSDVEENMKKVLLVIASLIGLIAVPALAQNTIPYEAGTSGLSTGVIPKASTGTAAGQLLSSAITDNATIVSSTESVDIVGNAIVSEIANAGSTGTTVNKLAKLTGAPSTAVITATTDPVSVVIGIVTGGAGTTSNAQIAIAGQASCIFDGATTAGDYVTISSTTAGDCHDNGTSAAAANIGRVLSTNGGTGTYAMTLAISGSQGGASFTYGVPLVNPKFIRVAGSNLSIGTTDLYTVPTGRRALIQGCTGVATGGGAVTVASQFKIGGTYYPIANSTASVGTTLQTSLGGFPGNVLEATDIVSIVTSVNNGLNMYCAVVEFDNTSALRGIRQIGLSTGDNTIYTVPAGKTATFTQLTNSTTLSANNSGSIKICNDAGGTHTFAVNNVPSGGSPASTNLMGAGSTLVASNCGTNTTGGTTAFYTLAAGDFISVNSSAGNAAQTVLIPVIEQ